MNRTLLCIAVFALVAVLSVQVNPKIFIEEKSFASTPQPIHSVRTTDKMPLLPAAKYSEYINSHVKDKFCIQIHTFEITLHV